MGEVEIKTREANKCYSEVEQPAGRLVLWETSV